MTSVRTWLVVLVVVVLGTAPPVVAQGLEEFELFIEINDTDGDAGIQIFADGDGWDVLRLLDPDQERILTIRGSGSIGMQGLTEGFFESAEPSFDVQTLSELLALFPEGMYKAEARDAKSGEWSRLRTELTHSIPGAPILVRPGEDEIVDLDDEIVVEWQPVADPPGSEIVSYEVIVELDDDDAPAPVSSGC